MKKIHYLLILATALALYGLSVQPAQASEATYDPEPCSSMRDLAILYAKARDAGIHSGEFSRSMETRNYTKATKAMAHTVLNNVYRFPKVTPIRAGDIVYDWCLRQSVDDTPAP